MLKIFLEENKKIKNNNVKEIKFECKYCKKIFSRKDNLKRHYEICKYKKEQIIEKETKKILKNLKRNINEKNILIEQNKKQEEIIKTKDKIIKEIVETNKKVFSYICENYQNASILQSFDAKAITEGEEGNKFIDKLIYERKFGGESVLPLCLGYIIINQYLEGDKKKQSIWTLDLNRTNFAVRILDKDGNNCWYKDEGGTLIAEKIINPMFNAINNECLKKLVDDNYNYGIGKTGKISDNLTLNSIRKKINETNEMKKDKTLINETGKKILKVIGPKFKENLYKNKNDEEILV